MRELMQELGFAPSQMTTVNNQLLSRLNDEDAEALTSEEFNEMFNSYMNAYNQSFNKSGVPVDRDLQGLYYQYNNSLSNLAANLNSSSVIGADGNRIENATRINAPSKYLMSPSQYVKEYNKLLAQSADEINQYFGIEKLLEPNAMPSIDDTPDTFSETETRSVLEYERDIQTALATEDDEAEYGGEEDDT